MRLNTLSRGALLPLAIIALPAIAQQPGTDAAIVVNGERPPAFAEMTAGPDVKGVIIARKGERMKIRTAEGTNTIIALAQETKVKSGGGLFGGKGNYGPDSLLNGMPVSIKTLQWAGGLVAREVTFKGNDFKTASMIRNGTAQQFEEQTAATEALRGRMADIDKYNVKSTMNVYFDTAKWKLTDKAKADLCQASTQAEGNENALMLVVGYTDSVGDDDYNQTLSEKRAASVMNYLQQVCHWKPYRMLTPTGMAKSDPAADNSTPEGKAQNRRVSVNVLVSKSVDVDS